MFRSCFCVALASVLFGIASLPTAPGRLPDGCDLSDSESASISAGQSGGSSVVDRDCGCDPNCSVGGDYIGCDAFMGDPAGCAGSGTAEIEYSPNDIPQGCTIDAAGFSCEVEGSYICLTVYPCDYDPLLQTCTTNYGADPQEILAATTCSGGGML